MNSRTFVITLELCYWLLIPIWILPWIIYKIGDWLICNPTNQKRQQAVNLIFEILNCEFDRVYELVALGSRTNPEPEQPRTNTIFENISFQMQEMSTSIEQMNQNQPPDLEQTQTNAVVENISAEMTAEQSQTKEMETKLINLDTKIEEINQNQPRSTIFQPPVQTENNPVECLICFNNMQAEDRYPIAFTTCGHTFCNICAAQIQNCPVCRGPTHSRIHLHF